MHRREGREFQRELSRGERVVPVKKNYERETGEAMGTIEQMIKELPAELQREVLDFVEFLTEKRARKKGRRLRQDWAGALREYRDQYTSLELQKKALEWRGD